MDTDVVNEKISKRSFFKGLVGAGVGLMTPKSFASPSLKERKKTDHLRICFGSCNNQSRSQSYWDQIAKVSPDHWFFLGDNIYADTRDLNVMEEKYARLKNNPYYSDFTSQVSIEGIWDDHDFGEDGSHKGYPYKVESQQYFLDFMDVPLSDRRRSQEGIYYTKEFSEGRIKTYFLDCRYHKDEKKGSDRDLLGETQWQWLESEFASSTSDINIIVSPIGVLLNRLFVTEDWAEYSGDKKRLFKLIAKYDLKGTFFLSGDKHFGAFIKRDWDRSGRDVDYFEFQSSGLTHTAGSSVLNLVKLFYGKKNVLAKRNFAIMDFDFSNSNPQMTWTLKSLEDSKEKTRRFELDSKGLWKRIS